jgi:hypothetical protein
LASPYQFRCSAAPMSSLNECGQRRLAALLGPLAMSAFRPAIRSSSDAQLMKPPLGRPARSCKAQVSSGDTPRKPMLTCLQTALRNSLMGVWTGRSPEPRCHKRIPEASLGRTDLFQPAALQNGASPDPLCDILSSSGRGAFVGKGAPAGRQVHPNPEGQG